MGKHTIQELKMRQALPLEAKIRMTEIRIREWVNEFGIDGVYVSFSGGKDSTVLLHIARRIYPDMKAVFVDTGLEYPEIREFVKTFDNVDWIKPKMNFKQVIEKYGYPFISKEVSKNVYYAKKSLERGDLGGVHLKKLQGTHIDKAGNKSPFCTEKYKFFLKAPFNISSSCCDVMKKAPAHAYEKTTGRVKITGQMAAESMLRTTKWLQYGCNGFDMKRPVSNPLSFWTEQDILRYIKDNNIEICSVYGDIVVDYDSEDQFDGQLDFSDLGLMTDTRKYKTTGCSRTGCMFCGYGCHLEKSPNRFEKMKETHPKQYDYIMRPKEQGGLGYKEVIDWINEHGNLNIRY